jgi:signal transduction histidine kinase
MDGGFWILMTVPMTLQFWLRRREDLTEALLFSAVQWLPWALFTPGFFWLSERFTLEKDRWKRTVWVHLAASLVTIVVLGLISLILQPLVENAIKHGIEGQLGPGIVRIAARRDGESLRLEVADNGPGLGQQEGRPLKEGVGLSNTRSRIEALGAGVGSLQLRSPTEGGLVAEVRLPWRPAPGPRATNSSPA